MFVTTKSPEDIVKNKNFVQVSDIKEIDKIIDKILYENKEKVSEFKKGKSKLFGFFIGQAMKKSQGKANPKILNEVLYKKLNSKN